MTARIDDLITDARKALKAARALETISLGVDRETREAATAAIARLEEQCRAVRYLLRHGEGLTGGAGLRR